MYYYHSNKSLINWKVAWTDKSTALFLFFFAQYHWSPFLPVPLVTFMKKGPYVHTSCKQESWYPWVSSHMEQSGRDTFSWNQNERVVSTHFTPHTHINDGKRPEGLDLIIFCLQSNRPRLTTPILNSKMSQNRNTFQVAASSLCNLIGLESSRYPPKKIYTTVLGKKQGCHCAVHMCWGSISTLFIAHVHPNVQQ